MGSEATCTATWKGKSSSGKARLETVELQFRGGAVKLNLPFTTMKKVTATDGTLRITVPAGVATFDLGAAAAKWAEKILRPPSRLDKLGAKPEWCASAIHIEDATFLKELRARIAELREGRVGTSLDAIFFGATRDSDLARLEKLKGALKPNGALWIVRPKGRPEISEMAVMRAGRAAGLVDVKVVSFSATHTAEKFVIPVAARR
jgi:hypothetical protein